MKTAKIICLAVSLLSAIALGVLLFVIHTFPLYLLYIFSILCLGGLLGNFILAMIELYREYKSGL